MDFTPPFLAISLPLFQLSTIAHWLLNLRKEVYLFDKGQFAGTAKILESDWEVKARL